MKKLMAWFKDEEGQGMVEYGLLIGLIAVVVVVALLVLGPRIRDMFQSAADNLTTAAAAT
ncbi:MAG TPA: Flp family type IVb pilin [Clostridiales bacterium]|nr:MAG: Flp/Fap pilin component [Firmicutes bacterium ADurb.Bin262]HOU10163.1 Flp family type IVb pilin [Clostridiales bacterium]OQA66973.1 MAG: Flp/Fap pilin component [Firmicutes bacterium ADurb.Bin262]OQA66974.1 MAG: Flp/Fap pilin component [Firmicutes bacterium ADurb.Bin262]HOU10164.1 Flp family type IVb pilin [Clostridiales bacterium]